MTEAIDKESLQYMNIELSKFQSLYEPLLAKKDMRAIKSLQSSKAYELDNKAMIVVAENGIVAASNNQQDLLNHWQASKTDIQADLVEKTIKSNRIHTQFSPDRNLLNGYINLCVRDLSKGLRNFSCGFLYYQLDVDLRQKQARTWLIKQSVYIAIGSALVGLLLMLILHFWVTGRVLKIQATLDLWSKGDRDVQIKFNGNDELNHIGNVINDLVKQFASDEQSLIFNQQVNDAIIQSANYTIITTDTQGIITSFNSCAERLLGYKRSELINKKSPAIIHDVEEIVSHNKKLSIELGVSIDIGFETFVIKARNGQTDENNWTYIHKNGDRIPVRLSITALYDAHGNINGFLGIAYNITEQLKAEEQLEQLAYFDPLTKLPNRMLYSDRLNQAIAFAKRNESQFSIFFLDLDKFKFVNDNYGHEVGDKLLVKVAEILTHCVRKSDTVARLGGDEFTVILPNMNNHYDPIAIGLIAEKIIHQISQDIIIDGHLIQIGASIGIAIYPTHGTDVSRLNKRADIAMYQAKDHGRGRYVFYDPDADITLSSSD
ncbi:PAS domain protein, probably [Oleispira antarctica RB-8]|uniref:PAS domain protein, probably n=1 Tax=Oleispira antarctica RB-8 TaxID=698738 RepID=R4YUR3_OLEAN|nr:PAS domain protein, probably [Oleispira antarctica RB-8]